MAEAYEVARWLIQIAANEEEPEYLSHLRLQKLLYYVQGWYLAQHNKPMFDDRIEAWAHGPVVVSVYPKFADHKYAPIPPQIVNGPVALAEEEAKFVDSVWNAYKGHSASSLRDMSHSEAPWKDARGNLDAAAKCENEITKESMKRFFTEARPNK